MTVTVLLFAQASDVAGRPEIQLEVNGPATVADVRAALLTRVPELRQLLDHCAFAVDQQYAGDDHEVTEHSEIGCIPPVSGG